MNRLATGLLLQLLHFVLVLAIAPALTGLVRKVKARLLSRRGPPLLQPYRDLAKLLRKETLMAENASWLYRLAPAVVLAFVWLAAGLVPGFTADLPLALAADLIVIVGLLAAMRFVQALAAMDIGTSFGGIGASREMTFAALAEPATLMVVYTIALYVHSSSLPTISAFMIENEVGLRVSFALALMALVMVAIAENARIPVDNPATHLELTMVHEAMILEYSGPQLALMEAAAMVKMVFHLSLIAAIFVPFGMALPDAGPAALALGLATWIAKLAVGAVALGVFEVSIAKMRVFRVAEFLGGALLLGLLATIFLYVSQNL
jgi:formate hydrogenlyase subunit 4